MIFRKHKVVCNGLQSCFSVWTSQCVIFFYFFPPAAFNQAATRRGLLMLVSHLRISSRRYHYLPNLELRLVHLLLARCWERWSNLGSIPNKVFFIAEYFHSKRMNLSFVKN